MLLRTVAELCRQGMARSCGATSANGYLGTLLRGLHTCNAAASPQYGGYLRTGQAATNNGPDDTAMRVLVTGACGQVGSELVSRFCLHALNFCLICARLWL